MPWFFSCNKKHDRSQIVIYQLLQNMGVVHWSLFIDKWIHCFPTESCSLGSMNSLKIQWNHLIWMTPLVVVYHTLLYIWIKQQMFYKHIHIYIYTHTHPKTKVFKWACPMDLDNLRVKTMVNINLEKDCLIKLSHTFPKSVFSILTSLMS